MNAASIGILLFQIPVILLVTGLCGELLERLRQPRVVGEIAGGLLLGPLLLQRVSPTAFAFLFPSLQLKPLEAVGTIGLIIFLFLMGSELDLGALRREPGAALGITFGSIYLPFAVGASLAPALRAHFGAAHTSSITFTLFIGVAMSITALPILERILQDRKNSPRPVDPAVATNALLSAAANDLLAWSILAFALALGSGPWVLSFPVARTLTLLVVYVAGMVGIIRPLARLLLSETVATWAVVIAAIPFAILNAQITHALGVHAFFGAFLAGICFPVRRNVWLPLEHALRPVVQITLPVFFALTGLRLNASSLRGSGLGWLVLILAAAVSSKLTGAALAARASGMSWRAASQIAALLNTRGLVELIVLTIGLDQGVLSPALFTLFIAMALLTTAMTSPLLDLITPAHDANSIWS